MMLEPAPAEAGGIPAQNNQGRFAYTGQISIPELGMYYYKARIYSPTLGRFLQTDPIGYKDDIDLYAYVGNDPVNKTDPTGTTCTQGKGEVFTCQVDAIVNAKGEVTKRADFTKEQKATLSKFEKAYSAAVNKLANSSKTVSVSVPGGSPFSVAAKEIAKSLADRLFTYAPSQASGQAGMTTGGTDLAGKNSEQRTNTYVYDREFGSKTYERDIVHEGIHSTSNEQIGNGYFMGSPPLGRAHQGPYNSAAAELLEPQ